MILKGNARGGARDLALHLMKDENDHVAVHELRGFVADDLEGALQESYAISKGTKCRQFLYSLSLNPPQNEHVSTGAFEAAIEKVETKLGLSGQPRAIVFHEKEGPNGPRRHAHAVWSRIDIETMTAKQLSYDRQKLQTVSRELYRDHGWKMPRGLANPSERDPLNFSLEEWQQAKRIGKDPKAIKAAFQDAWAISDSKAGFTHALAERGFHLAKGDRRGFVAVDTVTDEVFAIAKWTGQKTKAVRERLGDEDALPSIQETREHIARGMLPKLRGFQDQLSAKEDFAKQDDQRRKQVLVERQRAERIAQRQAIQRRAEDEARQRQARFRGGLGGVWDRLRGRHKQIAAQNALKAEQSAQRDRAEKEALIFQQFSERRTLIAERKHALEKLHAQQQDLKQDQSRFERVFTSAARAQDKGRPKPRPRIKTRTPAKPPNTEKKLAPPRTHSRSVAPNSKAAAPKPTTRPTPQPAQRTPSTAPNTSREAFDKAARKEAFLKKRRESQAPSRSRSRPPSPER